MFGTLIKMYILESYPVLSFPVPFFLVRHLFYFLCCATCLAWHWQINFHSLNFEISSCANLTPQPRRTPARFFLVCFSFFPFCTFLEDTREILHYDPRCFQLIITITSSDYYREWMTALQQTCSAFITVHDRTRPLEHEQGNYTSAVVVISRERVFLALPDHIKALSGQNYWLPDGSGSPGRAWQSWKGLDAVCRAADLFIYSDPTQPLSEGTLRVYSVNSPVLFVFLPSPLRIQQIKRGLG